MAKSTINGDFHNYVYVKLPEGTTKTWTVDPLVYQTSQENPFFCSIIVPPTKNKGVMGMSWLAMVDYQKVHPKSPKNPNQTHMWRAISGGPILGTFFFVSTRPRVWRCTSRPSNLLGHPENGANITWRFPKIGPTPNFHSRLVVWTIFYFSIQLGMSSSQLTNSYFSEGWLNHQPDP